MLVEVSPGGTEPLHGISPEQLRELTALLKAMASAPAKGPSTLEALKTVAELINSIAWPAAAVTCALLFRRELMAFVGSVDTVKIFGAEISRKIQREVNASGQEAVARDTPTVTPTESERKRALVVQDLVAGADIALIRNQAQQLAAEYEEVRASNLPGSDRTRKMDAVVSKMRTIGRAIFPLRHDFAASLSPGMRLVAIAALQIQPDFDMLGWLASRVGAERPFVEFQALVALFSAVHDSAAKAYSKEINAAVATAKKNGDNFNNDSSRVQLMQKIESAAAAISQG